MKDYWYARVVDVENDEEQAGRAKIRIFGIQDDTTKIPDSDLFWARPVWPITNPAFGGAAGQQTGLRVGSIVRGYWADEDEQIPLIDGVLGSAGKLKDNGELDQSTNHSVPKISREVDENEPIQYNIIEKAEINTQFVELKTLGAVRLDESKSGILQTLQSIDPTNLSGSVGTAVRGLKGVVDTMKSAGGFRDLIEGIASNGDLFEMIDKVKGLAERADQIKDEISGLADDLKVDLPIDIGFDPRQIVKENSPLNAIIDATGIEERATEMLKSALGGAVGPLLGQMKSLSGAAGILGAAGSFNFAMNKTMPNIEGSWKIIKNKAKEKSKSGFLDKVIDKVADKIEDTVKDKLNV